MPCAHILNPVYLYFVLTYELTYDLDRPIFYLDHFHKQTAEKKKQTIKAVYKIGLKNDTS